jgi:F-type H+-transporting ATPase subunit epsilon
MAGLRCVVVTPESTVLEEETSFVAVPLYDGELGIAPGHSPLIGRLGYGELRLRDDRQVSRYYVDGGFVEVTGNVVSVLTSRAVAAAQIDSLVVEETLGDAIRRPATSPESMEARDRVITQARAQLRVARRAEP